jgi:hypothetical protein
VQYSYLALGSARTYAEAERMLTEYVVEMGGSIEPPHAT